MSKVSFFVGVHVGWDDEGKAAETCRTVVSAFEHGLEGYDRAREGIGPVEVLNLAKEEPSESPIVALHAYGYIAVSNWPGRDEADRVAAEAKADAHVQALREALEVYRKKHSIIDRHLELVDCRSGDHRIIAIHYADYAYGGPCRFQLIVERGDRLHTGPETDWTFVRFYKQTESPRAREAIDELFGGWDSPPRWFFLAGTT